MGKRICALPGCERIHYGRGYCKLHHRRLVNHGSAEWTPPRQPEHCEVVDCERPSWARNMCSPHYIKWRKYGDPLEDRTVKRRACDIDACGRPVHGHGWCVRHYRLWRVYGGPHWQPTRHTECVVDGCVKQPRSALAALCEAHYMRLRRNGTLDAGQCSVCQEPLPLGSMINRQFCESCYLDRRRARSRDQEHRRRVAMLSGDSEHIDSLEIYERDGWKCGLCHRKVNPKLSWPHPNSASLDHIIPLAKGGHHVRTNVHLAHLTCNLSKQHRGGGEQLLLIG